MSLPVLFLVPARAGSVRVRGKNLRAVGGIPLVGRAVRIARAAATRLDGGPHRVVCSTDSPEISAAALAWGADEAVHRPAELASSDATSVEVALHALDVLEARGSSFRALVLVQPTSPLSDPADLLAAIARLDAGAHSVVSVTPSHPASWHQTIDARDGRMTAATGIGGDPADRLLSGAFYVTTPGRLRGERAFVVDGRTAAQLVPRHRSIDVDEELDLEVAELLHRRHGAIDEEAELGPRDRATRRRISVLTTGRQDWGILRSTCAAIRQHPELELDLIVGGMHLSPRHGRAVDMVRADGFHPAAELAWLPEDETEPDPPASEQAASAIAAVGRHLAAVRPDALLLVGDRFETLAAAMAATLGLVPIAHLHGGEQTLGAFDDALRHAITKLAHLHLVSNEEHARRVVAVGEDRAAVHVVGAPGLDNAFRADLPDRSELSRFLGIELDPPVVVVTVHPATLETDPAAAARAVVAAMDAVPATYVLTMPNVDPGAAEVVGLLRSAAERPGRTLAGALGDRRYWGLLRVADAMLGNSSSGLVEAPAIPLPVVNVGERQAGRHRGGTVLDVPPTEADVVEALRTALTPAYRDRLAAAPAGADGRAGERVAAIIAQWRPSRPPRKPPIAIDA